MQCTAPLPGLHRHGPLYKISGGPWNDEATLLHPPFAADPLSLPQLLPAQKHAAHAAQTQASKHKQRVQEEECVDSTPRLSRKSRIALESYHSQPRHRAVVSISDRISRISHGISHGINEEDLEARFRKTVNNLWSGKRKHVMTNGMNN